MAPERSDVAAAAAARSQVPLPTRIRRRRQESPGVWTLELEPPAGEAADFAPGQFNMLTAFGIGEIPVSLSGDPARRRVWVHTVRALGPVSRALAALPVGAALGLRGPFGRGWPLAAGLGRDLVLVAGGLGLAPLRPALYALLAERDRYGRVALCYGARGPQDLLFRREFAGWARGIQVQTTVDHAPVGWSGQVGVVTRLIERADFRPAQTLALVCGPEVMMRFAIAALRDTGVADEHIYLSLERNMKCAVALCGHCQFGGTLVCRDGPVVSHAQVGHLLGVREL